MRSLYRLILWASIGLVFPVQSLVAQDHQITLFRHNRAGAVTISFDDGYYSQLTHGAAMMTARGLPGTFFVLTNATEVSWADWRQLASQGHEIASHTLTHPDLTTLSDATLRYELSESRNIINQNVPTQSCLTIAYPYTVSDARVQSATSEFYIAARGGWAGDEGGNFNFYTDIPIFWPWPEGVQFGQFRAMNFFNTAGDNAPFFVPISTMDVKLDTAVTYHAWYVMYLHTIPDEAYYLDYFATLLDHIMARDLWVATYQDVAQYMRERLASTLSVLSSDPGEIQLTLTHSLDARYDEPLTIRSVVPSTWTAVNVVQGASYAIIDTVVEGSDRVVYYDARPNGGTIVLSSSQSQATLSSVSLSPAVVLGGTSSAGTVTLSGPAPAGGATVSLTSGNTAAVQVPPSVTVAAGATAASFTATTSPVPWDTAVTVTAAYDGASRSATLTVRTPLAALASLSLSPTTVVGGGSTTGTVALDRAAPVGGVMITLTSSNTAAAQVPSTVTVPAEATTATFTATTSPVGSNTPVILTALLDDVSRTATLTVTTAATALSGVSVSPASVVGGASSTGTVTLSGPAPAGGAVVTLTSSNTAAAQVPASVTVAAGASSATFTATTSSVATTTAVTITASYNSVSRTATLTVTAASALSGVSVSPASVVGGASSTGTVTLSGPAPAGGAVVTLTSSNTAAAQVPASVTVAAGATTAAFTVTTSAVASTTAVTITASYNSVSRTATLNVTPPSSVARLVNVTMNPASVVGGEAASTGTVTLDGPAPAGGAMITITSSDAGAAQVQPYVTVLAGATTATFEATTSTMTSTTAVTITALYDGITRTTVLTVTAPGGSAALSGVSVSPASVVGGASSTGTVTLSGPAPAGGAAVTLTSSNTAAAQVPASVTVAAGATSATFTATTSPVVSTTAVTITASYNSVSRTATLTVTAAPAALSAVGLSPTSVVGGASSTGTVTLNGPAPAGGAVVTLTSSNTAAAQVPASVTVAAGATSASFTVTTSPLTSNGTPRIYATYGTVTLSATLTVTAPVAAALVLDPTRVSGGTPSTGTVTLNGPAPAGGMIVTLASNRTAVAQVPASVTVAAGQTTATFTVTTSAVTSTRTATISARRGVTVRATLTVTR